MLIRMESGLRVEDSQCGMRVYPLGLVQAVSARAGRFGFETEIVTRAAWAGCPVVQVRVVCKYLPPGERVSHLNPTLATLRAIGMHARLLARAMLPWPRHPQWPGDTQTEIGPKASRGAVRRFLHWLNPADAWRQARRDRVGREAFAAALAVGAFIGNLPAYGLHAVIGLYTAKRLHLHPVGVVVGTHISTPPLGPVLNAAAICVGHLLLHGALPSSGAYDLRAMGFLGVLRRMALEWVVGSPIVGLACALLVFVIADRALRLAANRDGKVTPAAEQDARGSSSAASSSPADTPGSAADHPTGPAPGHVA
jgi:uncharacterized protein (DUF2062 family)